VRYVARHRLNFPPLDDGRALDDRQRARDLFELGYAHEMEHDLVPARQQQAIAVQRLSGAVMSTWRGA
jgi:hypothetical protein